MANHETVSEVLISDSEFAREFRELGSGFAGGVADMVTGQRLQDELAEPRRQGL